MSFATPLAGFLGASLAVIAALWLLRARREDHPLPSTLLWRRAVQDRQANVPRQRLRPSWLLVLQLLAAAALVLALTHPQVARSQHLSGHTIIVVDTSATMQATDVAPSRFDSARAQVAALVDSVGPQDRITLIAMGARARVVADVRGDAGQLRSALQAMRVENGDADLPGALGLATASAAEAPARLLLYSDGITTPLRAPARLPFDVAYHSVGAGGENLAITALSIENGSPTRLAAVHVANQGRLHHDTALEYRVDGRLTDRKPLFLEPGAGADLSFAVPEGARRVDVTLSPHDTLAIDDSAAAVTAVPRTYRVLLVTRRNLFLERALRLRADLSVSVVDPAAYHPDASVDLDVFDGFVPPQLPDRPTWFVGPPQDARLGTGGEGPVGRLSAANAADPLLADVDLSPVRVARARSLSASGFGRPLVIGAAGPVVLLRDAAPRGVLFGFDLHESDLPLRDAFPILVDRLSGFLLPQALPPGAHAPGDPVSITAPSASAAVSVTRPDGASVRLPMGGGLLSGDQTDEVGVYTVSIDIEGRVSRSAFAVDALDAGHGSVAPRPRPALSGTARASAADQGAAPDLELWPYLASAVLALLLVEWLVWARRR